MFRKFLIWVVKNLLVLLLVAFIFSTVALDLPGMAKGLFRDIFSYSSPEIQKDVIGKLTIACSALEGKDPSELRNQMSSSPLSLDFSKIGSLCKDYNSGKINDREFFFDVIGTAVPNKFELPQSGALEKYNSAMDFLAKNKIYYAIVLLALLGILFLLAGGLKSFSAILIGISFSMGILILLPFFSIMAYNRFVGIDTTPIVSSILQGNFSLNIKAIISVVFLLVLRTYTSFIITLGFLFLGAGIAGKIYIWESKNKSSKSEISVDKNTENKDLKKDAQIKTKKPEKEKSSKENRTKEEKAEEYGHRDRSYKEVLGELDEIHKKKAKSSKESQEE